jgi:hypothetical protein
MSDADDPYEDPVDTPADDNFAPTILKPRLTDQQLSDIRHVEMSGIFDVEWYQLQSGQEFGNGYDAVFHYVLAGSGRGLSPHPLWSHAWINRNRDVLNGGELRTFVRYLTEPAFSQLLSTSPLFDPTRLPAGLVPAGATPLAAFLASCHSGTVLPYDPERHGLPEDITLGAAWSAARIALGRDASTDIAPDPRDAVLDALPEERVTGTMTFILVVQESGNDFRYVYDRIAGPRAVQRHGSWELLVLDPFQVGDAALAVEAVTTRDPRVRYVALDSPDLADALNAAVATATGDAIAFCDLSFAWSEEFTPRMLRALQDTDAARAVTPDGAPCFTDPRDCVLPGLVVRRELLVGLGGFDTTVGSAYAAELAQRVLARSDAPPVPGAELTTQPDATSVHRSGAAAWRSHVVDRAEWDRYDAPADRVTATFVVHDAAPRDLFESVAAAVAIADGSISYEVVVTTRCSGPAFDQLAALLDLQPFRTAVVQDVRATDALLLNGAIREAQGEVLVVVGPGQRLTTTPETFAELVAKVRESGAPTHPAVVDSHGLLVDAGSFYPAGTTEPVPALRGYPLAALGDLDGVEVPSAAFPLVLRTSDVRAVRGFDSRLDRLWLGDDIVRRLSARVAAGCLLSSSVRATLVAHRAQQHDTDTKHDIRTFRAAWPKPPTVVFPFERWSLTPHVHGASHWSGGAAATTWLSGRFQVTEHADQRRWLIVPRSGGVPDAPAGPVDFAESLAAALRRAGQVAAVQDGRSTGFTIDADVAVDLDGVTEPPLPATATTVLWATDDVDRISPGRVRGYDHVFSAAPLWCEQLWNRERIAVRPLLNCTDPERFFVTSASPVPDIMSVHVGDPQPWRQVSVYGSIHQSFRVGGHFRVHGRGWAEKIPPRHIGHPIRSLDALREIYQTAHYVTVDHRPELRDLGLISSQVFDVLAAGGNLLSDEVAGLDELFGGRVAIYRNWLELAWSYSLDSLCYYPTDSGKAKVAAEIAEHHSFDARARTLIEAVSTGSQNGASTRARTLTGSEAP